MAAENPIKLNFGAYLIQFDKSKYDVECRNDVAIVTAKDDPERKVKITILPSVPWSNLSEDTLHRIKTTSRDLPWKIEEIPSENRGPGPERIQVDGRDGFRVHRDYFNGEGSVILSAERVGCWLDDLVMCEILAIYPPGDESTIRLIREVVESLHFEKS
jgi:hypothetical protein